VPIFGVFFHPEGGSETNLVRLSRKFYVGDSLLSLKGFIFPNRGNATINPIQGDDLWTTQDRARR
jgi:hypothetical protein